MNLSTRIELLDRIPFEDLKTRWASDPTVPAGLALKKVEDGSLRAQFYGYLVESGPGAGERSGSSPHVNSVVREPEWLTLQPSWACRFLSGSKLALPARLEMGYPAKDLIDLGTLPTVPEGCHRHLVTEARNLFESGKIEIVTADILKIEKALGLGCSREEKQVPSGQAGSGGSENQLRGNNHRVQINILEAVLITLCKSIEAGTAKDFVHTSVRHSGLNATKLSKEIDDHRHQFHALRSEAADGTPPRGATVEAIQELITKAQQQLVSKNTRKSTPRKTT